MYDDKDRWRRNMSDNTDGRDAIIFLLSAVIILFLFFNGWEGPSPYSPSW